MLLSRKISIANGTVERYAVAGNYIFITDTGSLKGWLLVETDNGDKIEMRVGDEVYLKPFTNIFISHSEIVPITVKFAVGTNDERYKTSSVFGSVSVVNGEVQRVKNNQSFFGFTSMGAVAGQYCYSQITNPLGSGKNLIVNKISVQSSLAGFISINSYDTLLTNLSAAQPFSKMIGAAGSSAVLRVDSSAAVLGFGMQFVGLAANGEFRDFIFTEPILLLQGKSLLIYPSSNVNSSLNVNYQFNEEPI